MYLVISSSFNSDSRSRILAETAAGHFGKLNESCEFVDLAKIPLPVCDGDECYADPEVQRMAGLVKESAGILLAVPIYNFDVNSAAKNLVELTGKAWTEKVVGFLCAAGGQGSYMSIMALANSLMLDFRSFILSRFVYTTSDAFQGDEITDQDLQQRIEGLVEQMVQVAPALNRL